MHQYDGYVESKQKENKCFFLSYESPSKAVKQLFSGNSLKVDTAAIAICNFLNLNSFFIILAFGAKLFFAEFFLLKLKHLEKITDRSLCYWN